MKLVSTLEEIEEFISENKKVLFFVADSACSTSRALDNKIEEFSKKNQEVKVIHTVLSAIPSIASQYMIFIAPMIILFINGKEVYREGRFIEFQKLEEFL